jgi:predicted GIY-YIG superfamily endonuclease
MGLAKAGITSLPTEDHHSLASSRLRWTQSTSFVRIMNFPYMVYILRTGDDHTYVGCTSNLDERLRRHQTGMVHYTSDKLPVECIAAFGFQDKYKAFAFEKYLKSGSGRAFMNKRSI